MGTPLNPTRVVAWSMLLGLAGAAIVGLGSRGSPAPEDLQAAPWIEFPRSGMDASEFPTRQVVNWGDWSQAGRSETLAWQCGNPERNDFSGNKERYVARIGKDAWGPTWKIVIDVERDHVDIAWSHGGAIPPPPPPSGGKIVAARSGDLIVPVAHVRKSRIELEKIRELWSDEALWHAPQDAAAFACLDGNPVFLEACVNGRYAARSRNCNARAENATTMLWRAFNELLPQPPEPQWRESAGLLNR